MTAGTVRDVSGTRVLLEKLACVPITSRGDVTMEVERGCIVENKSQVQRTQRREAKERRHNVRPSNRREHRD